MQSIIHLINLSCNHSFINSILNNVVGAVVLLRGVQEAVDLPVRCEPLQGLPPPQAGIQRQRNRTRGIPNIRFFPL